MIALTSQTAAAIALRAAEGSWVMFTQAMPPGVAGPVMINGVSGRALAQRLQTIQRYSPYDTQLIGLMPSEVPDEDAAEIANEFGAYQIHDWWFDPRHELLSYVAENAQDALVLLLAETHPGGLSDAPVDIERIAEILDVSVPTVRRMVKAKQIPFLRWGRLYRFVPNDVLASLRR